MYLLSIYPKDDENILINNPYIQIFHISGVEDQIFNDKDVFIETTAKYPQYNKYDIDKTVMTIYNCQIFESNNLKSCWEPNDVILFGRIFIKAHDYIDNYGQRVECFTSLLQQNPEYYINYNEMHYLKIDYHISNPLHLLQISSDQIESIKLVQDDLIYSTELFDRLKSKSSKTEKHVEEKLTYAFHKIYKHFNHIKGYISQIYAVNQAIKYLSTNVEHQIYNKNHKGCIYQVKTGEGKSIIVFALAEIFARMGKKVHIVTSNIVLACRDYEKSFNYFEKCGFKSSILLHEGEFEKVNCHYKYRYYPSSDTKDLYHKRRFDNSSNMNTKVFKKSDIVFSTFFNFEGWYMRECEEKPSNEDSLNDYFKKCCLIIDESDTILIDELTNGTIISREMKSNAIPILEKVYDMHQEKKKANEILDVIKTSWPKCNDININDVIQMQREIDFAMKFKDGTRYKIEKDEKENFYEIIPFDAEHKGIIEKEKEFSGFIHQFIGIKEKKANPHLNIHIRPLSLNYLFISHPIYVNLYKVVWGFTGTIGTQKDKKILKKYYNLDTVEIPENQLNIRKDLPPVLCQNKDDRNKKILEEIVFFHKKGNPVLVIFENVKEIDEMQALIKKEHKEINLLIFNGTDMNKSTIENSSGLKGMVTLGTNFCGRGTNIEYANDFPLHVIIAYGPRNNRSLCQAYGRTGRNGKKGTTRIICTKKDFFKITKIPKDDQVNSILNEYDLKKSKQTIYIESFKSKRPWIFDPNKIRSYDHIFTQRDKESLRDLFINVNRNTAYNYEYPICMSVDTFIKIQLQKIFSLKNCPECKYTWILFQRYLRELILESWSIFIDNVTKKYHIDNPDHKSYEQFFEKEYKDLSNKLSLYLPTDCDRTINETFMRIHACIEHDWKKPIMNYFPSQICDIRKPNKAYTYISFKAGFFPFELKDKSGARICFGNKKKKDICFIEDPELIYGKKCSITIIIDKIFEKICECIDDKISGLLGLHFYIRRTMAGCEFGICVDPLLDDIVIEESHCLFDVKPILLFAICCKSLKPFLAGILIILAIFIGFVATKLAEFFASPESTVKDLIKFCGDKLFSAIKSKCKDLVLSAISNVSIVKKIMNKIIKWLKKQILKELQYDYDPIAIVMRIVLNILDSDGEPIRKKANEAFTSLFTINPLAKELFNTISPVTDLIKIGFLLLILIAAFIKNFKANFSLKKSASSYQNEFSRNSSRDLSNFDSYYESNVDVKRHIQLDDKLDEE